MNGYGKWGKHMAKISFSGIDEYAEKLGILWKKDRKMIEGAVYAGAEIVADEIKKGLNEIPIQEGKNGLPPVGTPENPLTGISRRQKKDLIDGFGLAPMEDAFGMINTKAGFDGYGSIKTRRYPKGTPNAMLIRSIEGGTSFRKKHPVIRTAVKYARKRAIQKMQKKIDESMKEIF